ncbi:MAG: hypothetical protein B6D62_01195 [Candidatus Cloacimonas sp. 4484_275]|nr:MAG: hypothetical protein B6D62_01195 [Candidatus Cloacimonas sp. 4484_275]
MSKKFLLLIGVILFAKALFSYNFFSPIIKKESFLIDTLNLEIKLKYDRIIVNSEKVFQDSVLLINEKDYDFDWQNGIIRFKRAFGHIKIEYMIYPENLLTKFYYYQIQELSDSSSIKIPKFRRKKYASQANLNISGNKTIAVSIASNEDFNIDQSLFLRINGELSKNLQIEAQLSDSQSPITPEGDSRELSSLDQVYLKLYGKQYEIAFGDLEMEFKNTEFFNYKPKFEGLKIGWFGKNKLKAAIAISKGKKTTKEFYGTEAKQGPYYLSVNAEGVQVVPGTEEIFLNGNKMQRGSDYTIDYAEGSITFSDKHFISANSHIFALFQYSDENFRQNIYLSAAKINLGDKFQIGSRIVIQNDDKDNPLQETFSEEDIQVLKISGDSTVWADGIFEVEIGEGQYILEGNDFIYVGPDSTGNYNLHYTYVGTNGDYDRNEHGDFIWNAGGNGAYVLKKKLQSPQKKANYDLNFDFSGNFYSLRAEGIFTEFDKNTFSGKDDDDNYGTAVHFGLNLFPDFDKIEPKLTLYYRRFSDNLSAFSEIEKPVDSYEIGVLPDSLQSGELYSELKMNIFRFYSPQIQFRRKYIKDYVLLNYFSFASDFSPRKYFPKIYHRYLFWQQDFDEFSQNLINKSKLNQHDLNAVYNLGNCGFGENILLKTSLVSYRDFPQEGKKDFKTQTFFDTEFNRKITNKISYTYEKSDTLNLSSVWKKEQYSHTFSINSYLNFPAHQLKFDFSHREVQTDKRKKYDIGNASMKSSFWKNFLDFNSKYSVKNIEFYPKIRQLIPVSYGIYDSTGVVDETGEGGWDWVVTDIDYEHPQMSVEVNGNFSLFITPASITNSFWKKLQSETAWVVTENSISENKTAVYLLQPSVLMNKKTTIYGRNDFEQTLWLEILKRRINSRLRFHLQKSLDKRYNDESEEKEEKSWEGTLRFLSFLKAGLEIGFEKRTEKNSYYLSESKFNIFKINLRKQILKGFTLNSQIDFSNEQTNKNGEKDDFEINSLKLTENITYFFKRKYRIFSRLIFKKNMRKGSAYLNYLNEKKNGNIFKWNLSVVYKIGKFTSANLEYSGNSYPETKDVHKIKVEVKAEF